VTAEAIAGTEIAQFGGMSGAILTDLAAANPGTGYGTPQIPFGGGYIVLRLTGQNLTASGPAALQVYDRRFGANLDTEYTVIPASDGASAVVFLHFDPSDWGFRESHAIGFLFGGEPSGIIELPLSAAAVPDGFQMPQHFAYSLSAAGDEVEISVSAAIDVSGLEPIPGDQSPPNMFRFVLTNQENTVIDDTSAPSPAELPIAGPMGSFRVPKNTTDKDILYFVSLNSEINFTHITIATIGIVIPSENPAPASYAVTVSSAGTGSSGGGDYAAGAVVNISAGTPPQGKQFKNWSASPAVSFDDANSASTSFVMISEPVTATAVFEDIPGDGDGDNGDGDGTGDGGNDNGNGDGTGDGGDGTGDGGDNGNGNGGDNGDGTGDGGNGNGGDNGDGTGDGDNGNGAGNGENKKAENKNAVYTILTHFGVWNGAGDLSARIDADYTKFARLLYGSTEIDPAFYTITQGSTIITLRESFLKTYPAGTHEFVAEFSDGRSAAITLTVSAAPVAGNPVKAADPAPASSAGTGDDANPVLWSCMGALAFVFLLGAIVIPRRRKVRVRGQ
jgi:hypothetical protein